MEITRNKCTGDLKNLPAVRETQVPSLGQEDPLEKEMQSTSVFLPGEFHGHEFGWTLGVGDGQGDLACCSPWGCKESNTTEQLN